MGDLVDKMNEALAVMSFDERLAYSRGLSHAFTEVFAAFGEHANGRGAFNSVLEIWERARAIQIIEGLL